MWNQSTEEIDHAAATAAAPVAVRSPENGEWYNLQSIASYDGRAVAFLDEINYGDGKVCRRVRARVDDDFIELPPSLAKIYEAFDQADPAIPRDMFNRPLAQVDRDAIIAEAAAARAHMNINKQASLDDMRGLMQEAKHIAEGVLMQKTHAETAAVRQAQYDEEARATYALWLRGKALAEQEHHTR